MLLAAVVTLRAQEPATIPANVGRANYAWLLDRILEHDAALADRLHGGEEPRPFTVSDLWGNDKMHDGQMTLGSEQEVWLRLTGLNEEASTAIAKALPEAGEQVSLLGAALRVETVATERREHPWAGRARYAELAQRYTLDQERVPDSVTLRFASPALFRWGGKDVPLPLPHLVFHGYLQKWNAFAPIALPEEAKRYAEECVALSRFQIRSRLVCMGKETYGGFTGQVRFRFLVHDAYWMRVMRLLAGYAFWAGTGYRTTVGLGQTQEIER